MIVYKNKKKLPEEDIKNKYFKKLQKNVIK